jgi:hypothetical protein
LAVRLFVGNLSYSTTEAELRAYFGTVAPPSQVVLPVDRETGNFRIVLTPNARFSSSTARSSTDVRLP